MIFLLGTMKKAQTLANVPEANVGDVYIITSDVPKSVGVASAPWSPLTCGEQCLGASWAPVLSRRNGTRVGTYTTMVNAQLSALSFRSNRFYPLMKLDLLKILPSSVDEVVLADADANLMVRARMP